MSPPAFPAAWHNCSSYHPLYGTVPVRGLPPVKWIKEFTEDPIFRWTHLESEDRGTGSKSLQWSV